MADNQPARILPDALYSRKSLAEVLSPLGIDVDTFIGRLKPRKVFRKAWLGEHILEAFRAAPGLDESNVPPKPKNKGNRNGRGAKSGRLFSDADLGIKADE
jgi:hypothetical protein